MLVIRLRRIGRRGDPHYRIVVAEHTAPVQGKFIAEIGHFHPKSKEIVIQDDQFLAWMEQGAQPSNTVARLAEKSGLAHERIVIKQFQGKPKKKASTANSPAKEEKGEVAQISSGDSPDEGAGTTEISNETETSPESEVTGADE
jgi:small subunit ribosomal protein S16